jgi:hypothetical protein
MTLLDESPVNSYVATGLSMGNNYVFQVVGVNAAGSSLPSVASNFIIAAVVPNPPTNVVRLNADSTFISIGW